MDDDNRQPPDGQPRAPRRRKPSELYRAFRRWLATDPIEPPPADPFPLDLRSVLGGNGPYDGGGYQPGGFGDSGGGHHHH